MERICALDEMPDRKTVLNWYKQIPEFRLSYDRAREHQADALVDQCIDIADGIDVPRTRYDANIPAANDVGVFFDFGNTNGFVGDRSVERDRLRIDTRKWLAGKLRPRKYGATQHVEISGNSDKPIMTVSRIEIVAPGMIAAQQAPALPDIEHEALDVDASD